MVFLKLKSVSAALSSVLLCTALFFGCGKKQFDLVLTLDGEAIAPATYRMYQIQSYFEAAQQVSSLADTIDGLNAVEWINRNTLELLRKRRYYDQQFTQQELSFTDAQLEEINQQSTQRWDSAGAVYLRNGVDRQTFFDYQLSAARQNALFDQFCADLTDEEIQNYLDEEFVLIEYTQLPCFDSDGNLLEEDALEQVQDLAEDALRSMRTGEKSFQDACADAVAQSYEVGGFSSPDLENPDNYIFSSYLSLSPTGDAETDGLVQSISQTAVGRYGSYEDGQFILLFHRLPNWETEEDFEALRPSVLWQMRGADFEAAGSEVWEQYELQTDEDAVAFYAPQKLDLSSPTEEELQALKQDSSSGASVSSGS